MERRAFIGTHAAGGLLAGPLVPPARGQTRARRLAFLAPRSLKRARGWLGGLLVGLLVAGILLGCSISPAQQDAIRRAWEARDAERSRECERMGRGFVAGGCTGGGGP